MKYAYAVPAWLGAVKVLLVLFGIPALVAFFAAPVVGRRLELSPAAEAVVAVMVLLIGAVANVFVLVAWGRRAAKKKSLDSCSD
jgi:Zn-dependent protease